MDLEKSIKKTINYAKSFGKVLTRKQLEERLISATIFSKKEIDIFLKKRPNFLKKIKDNEKNCRIKMAKAWDLSKHIEQYFDSIIFLGITGSVAAENCKKNDDIDLLIITKSNTLWLTRLRLRWFIFWNKIPHRKYSGQEKANQFCFNLWLDENFLALSPNKQNLKNAVDLVLLKPLINKNKTYEKFLLANSWAKKWMATEYNKKIKPSGPKFRTVSLKKGDLNQKILNFLVFVPQFLWMWPKIRGEKIGLGYAFFHKN